MNEESKKISAWIKKAAKEDEKDKFQYSPKIQQGIEAFKAVVISNKNCLILIKL